MTPALLQYLYINLQGDNYPKDSCNSACPSSRDTNVFQITISRCFQSKQPQKINCLPLEQKGGLFTVQQNKDNLFPEQGQPSLQAISILPWGGIGAQGIGTNADTLTLLETKYEPYGSIYTI